MITQGESQNGCFIAIEGIDGAGKTTLAHILSATLKQMGYSILNCGRSYFDSTHTLLDMARQSKHAVPYTIAMAYALDYFMQMDMVIKPALANGEIVLSDRYIFSSIAYNTAFGLEKSWSLTVYRASLLPHKTFFLEIDPNLAVTRQEDDDPLARGFSQDKLEFQHVVRNNYLSLNEQFNFEILDATQQPEFLANKVLHLLQLESLIK